MKITKLLFLFILLISIASATELKPIKPHPDYNHDKFKTLPKDIYMEFGAYAVSFDSKDDNDGDGKPDTWGIPEWVAYETKAFKGKLGAGPKRPGKWITDYKLFMDDIAPDDSSYELSSKYRKAHPKEPAYDRGHMCMKQIAFRIGKNEDWNTHTIMNCCPQRDILNRKIWLDLENITQKYADKYKDVWIICGPVIYGKKPKKFLGEKEKGEFQVAIPDAFFKIIIKQSSNVKRPDVLAFIYPQEPKNGNWPKRETKYRHENYLVSVNDIEKVTGLDFLTILPDNIEEEVEGKKPEYIWS